MRSQAALLGSVALVLQHTTADALPLEVALRINAFIDPASHWTLETATEAGHANLLTRLAAREWPGVDLEFRQRRYFNGLAIAAKRGRLDVLKWWAWSYLQDPPPLKAAMVYAMAARYGHVHILQWLKDEKLYAQARYSVTRVSSNHPSVVRWLAGEQSMQTNPVLAAISGDLAYIRWLHSRPQEPSLVVLWDCVSKEAASHGQFKIVQWMYANRRDDCKSDALMSAIQAGHLSIAQWILAQSSSTEISGTHGIACTDLETLKWALDNIKWSNSDARLDFVDTSIVVAAAVGQLDVLEVYANDQDLDRYYGHSAMIEAARHGHLHVVQWLHAKGVPLTDVFLTAAIENSQLHCAQWLSQHYSSEWREQTTNTAVRHGQLQALQWLHARGIARYGQHTMRLAAQHGHLEIVKWIHSHVDRSTWWSADPLFLAVNGGHLHVAKWLYETDRDLCISLASRPNGTHFIRLSSERTSRMFDPSLVNHECFALEEWLLQCADA